MHIPANRVLRVEDEETKQFFAIFDQHVPGDFILDWLPVFWFAGKIVRDMRPDMGISNDSFDQLPVAGAFEGQLLASLVA